MRPILLLLLSLSAAFCVGCIDPQFAAMARSGDGPTWIDRRGEHLADYVISKHVKPLAGDLAAVVEKHAGTRSASVQAQAELDEPVAAAPVAKEDEELVILVCRDNRCDRPARIKRSEWPKFWKEHGAAQAKFTFLSIAGKPCQPPKVLEAGVTAAVNVQASAGFECRCGPNCPCRRMTASASFESGPVYFYQPVRRGWFRR